MYLLQTTSKFSPRSLSWDTQVSKTNLHSSNSQRKISKSISTSEATFFSISSEIQDLWERDKGMMAICSLKNVKWIRMSLALAFHI